MCEDNKRWEKSRQTWRYALLHKFLPENIEAIKKKIKTISNGTGKSWGRLSFAMCRIPGNANNRYPNI